MQTQNIYTLKHIEKYSQKITPKYIENKPIDRASYRFRTSEIVKGQYCIQSNTKNQTNLYNIKRLRTSLEAA